MKISNAYVYNLSMGFLMKGIIWRNFMHVLKVQANALTLISGARVSLLSFVTLLTKYLTLCYASIIIYILNIVCNILSKIFWHMLETAAQEIEILPWVFELYWGPDWLETLYLYP